MSTAQKLGLGTVQFGQAYGVSNARGRVPPREVTAILDRAAAAGISVLDTAAAYGESETVLGGLCAHTQPFRMVTKTLPLSHGLARVVERARQSTDLLQRRPLDALLVHAAGDLRGPEGPALWKALQGLRDEGQVREIGISAYIYDDPLKLAQDFAPTVMQIPLSIFDQTLLRNGTLARLKDLGVEIHVRSVFLQGLMFLSPDKLPPKLAHARGTLEQFHRELKAAGTTPLAAALDFVTSLAEVDVAVIGVTALSELEEILGAVGQFSHTLDWARFAIDDPIVTTPSKW